MSKTIQCVGNRQIVVTKGEKGQYELEIVLARPDSLPNHMATLVLESEEVQKLVSALPPRKPVPVKPAAKKR